MQCEQLSVENVVVKFKGSTRMTVGGVIAAIVMVNSAISSLWTGTMVWIIDPIHLSEPLYERLLVAISFVLFAVLGLLAAFWSYRDVEIQSGKVQISNRYKSDSVYINSQKIKIVRSQDVFLLRWICIISRDKVSLPLPIGIFIGNRFVPLNPTRISINCSLQGSEVSQILQRMLKPEPNLFHLQ